MTPSMLLFFVSLLALLIFTVAEVPSNVPGYQLQNQRDVQMSDLYNANDPSNSTVHGFERRWFGPVPLQADDRMWNGYVCKGRKLMLQMSLSDADVAAMLPVPKATVQSAFSYESLAPWGYQLTSYPESYRDLKAGGPWGVAGFFDFLKISSKFTEEGGDWMGKVILHFSKSIVPWQTTDPNQMAGYMDPYDKHRRSTAAFSYIAVNPGAGMIMVQNTVGPRASADRYYPNGFPDNELPEMRHLSDMIGVNWQYAPGELQTNVKYFLSLGITNEPSLALISRALSNFNAQLEANPRQFPTTTDEGLALLGSPNGASFAHFLIERKYIVGLKSINAVWVWECESDHKHPCMMFGVVDVPTPAERPSKREEKGKYSVVREHQFFAEGNQTVVEKWQ